MSKKSVEETKEVETTVVEEPTVEEEAVDVKDPKADWPTIFIPRRNKEDSQRMFSINFKEYLVQTGKSVQVPPELYEVYMNSVQAEETRDNYETANQQ